MIRLRIKEVAQEKGFGQGKLARSADMATNTLRAIFRNPYREVSTTTINKLAKALAVPVTTLIEDVSEEFAQQEQEKLAQEQ
ncbi:MAG TPA: helix-turn-helix transcriptional regulator [Ktedonosporobacter sp.]|nr:helix-turn-helix transcriptional regulator [Ktedonosporobacter sp.]